VLKSVFTQPTQEKQKEEENAKAKHAEEKPEKKS